MARAACPSLKSRAERGPAAHPSRVGGMTAPFLKNGRLKWSCRLPLKRQAGPVCHPFLKNGLQAACCPLLQGGGRNRLLLQPQRSLIYRCASVFLGLSSREGLPGKGFPGKRGASSRALCPKLKMALVLYGSLNTLKTLESPAGERQKGSGAEIERMALRIWSITHQERREQCLHKP